MHPAPAGLRSSNPGLGWTAISSFLVAPRHLHIQRHHGLHRYQSVATTLTSSSGDWTPIRFALCYLAIMNPVRQIGALLTALYFPKMS
jgi:hypothetical protein